VCVLLSEVIREALPLPLAPLLSPTTFLSLSFYFLSFSVVFFVLKEKIPLNIKKKKSLSLFSFSLSLSLSLSLSFFLEVWKGEEKEANEHKTEIR